MKGTICALHVSFMPVTDIFLHTMCMAERITLRDAVGALAEKGREFFTIDDLAGLLGVPPQRARVLAARLAKANLVRRVKRGLYALLPPTDWRDRTGYAVNWYATAAELVRGDPYFLAYYTAMEIHQMTQHPLRTVVVATTGRRRGTQVGPVRFRFVTLAEKRLFGFEHRRIEGGWNVAVADLERTFIDCVDRPDLCGGLEEVFHGFDRRHGDLNRDRLIRYLLQFGEPAAVKRVGFLLEAVGHADPPLLWELERLARRQDRYLPLTKNRPHQGGQKNRRWGLVVGEDLLALVRQGRT